MSRTFKGYRVGIIKPDGARRYMKPRSDGKWSLSETKPMLLDEDEMSDALDEVGDFMVGEDVSFSTPVFATRKPKPAPAEGAAEGPKPVAWVTTSPGGSQVVNFARPPFAEERHDGWKVAPLYRHPPVVAAEGRYAALLSNNHLWPFDGASRGKRIGTHGEAVAALRMRGETFMIVEEREVIRILADGEHEAAVEAARREERERVLGLVAAERERVRGRTSDGYLYALDWFEEAAKGQAK